jgi:hypothetical protein
LVYKAFLTCSSAASFDLFTVVLDPPVMVAGCVLRGTDRWLFLSLVEREEGRGRYGVGEGKE